MDFDGSMMAALVAAITALVATGASYGRAEAQINRLRAQVDKLDEELSDVRVDQADRMARIETKLDQIDSIDHKVDLIVARLNNTPGVI